MTEPFYLLAAAIFIVALLYSSVGHAGASGYIAVLTLFGFGVEVIRPTALTLNILVAAIGFIQWWRGGHFLWSLFWPFALLSVPAAGGDRTQAVSLEVMKKMITELQPQTPLQRKLQESALGLVDQIERDRYSIEALSTGNLSMYLVFIPVFWIAALTLIYSTLATRNYTVLSVLFICSLSIAASIFLIVEMSAPLDGRIKVSSAPARKAIEMLGK